MLKFNYGFATRHENVVRVLKTNNYVLGLLFCDLFEDENLAFNGTEWSSFYYFKEICDASQGTYSRAELDQAMDERVKEST
mmetsp:Transcript_44675/g.59272  ORF Transcript_44675/g.59272 Transcript_44675/m.59272 type:complete len:81 (-) Transcript_44675:62-304(-)